MKFEQQIELLMTEAEACSGDVKNKCLLLLTSARKRLPVKTALHYPDFKHNDHDRLKRFNRFHHDLMPRIGHSTGMQGKCSAFQKCDRL